MDKIPAELYKADSDVAVKELTRLFNRIWETGETLPKEERLDRLNGQIT